jgi:phosphoesterase RecJ-like protein
MSDKVKQLAPQIWDEIQKAKNILLHCHPNPDPDSIGSSLALYLMLKDLDKDVTIIYGDSKKKSQYEFLPKYDEVIEKNFLEIGPENFDLFISCDSGNLEQISNRPLAVFPQNLKVINIDHHSTNSSYGFINLVDTDSPATAELIYQLITEWKINITQDIAVCLFLGIYTDTGGFKYPKTSPDTFLYASELAKIAPNFPEKIFLLENSMEPKQIEYLGLALNSIEHYFSNNIAIVPLSFEALKNHGIEAKHTEKMEVANILKSAVGWNIGIAFTEIEPGHCNVSMRTRDANKYDLSKLAKAIGGGGHPPAAGAKIKMPFEEAKKYLLQKITEVYPELGNP